ncbi:MAG TPA: TasA family protein [Egibacteraceae bacterium]|nr:TasA family protein [Egibacteraceae bacterium]
MGSSTPVAQGASRSRKVLLSVAAMAAAASIAGLGTYATFSSSTSASQPVSSGTVTIALGTAGGADNRLTIGASDVAPGDTIQRHVKLSNSGSLNLADIKLTTAATTSSLLDTDATNGLQMVIDKCVAGWVESLTTPYTYTCADLGGPTTVLASRAVIGSNLALSGLSATTAGANDSLRVTLTLPATADNTFQGKTSTVQYTFTGTQRAATSK